MARVLKGSHSFTCTSARPIRNRNKPYLPLPSLAIAGTHLPTPEGWKAECRLGNYRISSGPIVRCRCSGSGRAGTVRRSSPPVGDSRRPVGVPVGRVGGRDWVWHRRRSVAGACGARTTHRRDAVRLQRATSDDWQPNVISCRPSAHCLSRRRSSSSR